MIERLVIPDKTIRDQRRAADPRASAWVSANAGAGKTKVLTDRVLRLLLAGSAPGRILCLTFTKAAAANMAIRIFERLGRWVTLDEETLAKELMELEGIRPDRERLRLARRLFARAVETPGGLKIDTLHAFCERILHMVPFEANVPARFSVLDDGQSAELVAEATANVLAEAASGHDALLADALHLVSIDAGGDTLVGVIKAAVRCRAILGDPGTLRRTLLRLQGALGVAPGDCVEAVERAMLDDGLPPTDWPEMAAALRGSRNKTDRERGDALLAGALAQDPRERLGHYRSIFFKEDGEPRAESRLVTGAVDPGLKEELLREQARLLALEDRLKGLRAFERTNALFTLASQIRGRIETTKARLGVLDFDDLIHKTLALLQRGEAAWILYKLDRGIDHVLVDEAQDTNPEQWEILRLITADFTAGTGAAGDRVRTLFAVGDPKQSIYSFQGAAPREFEDSRRLWAGKVSAAKLLFEDVRLDLSFRSVKAVLSAVDATFAVQEHFRGLSFEDAATGTLHHSARPDVPGLVELWPVERPAAEVEPEAWTLPLDEPEKSAPAVVVARRVASAVRTWTTRGDERGRVWKPSDILILVRKRGAAFAAVIRALKDAGVPVAGADRLDIGEHIAVQDLVAAGRAALLPGDDLTLATALKSPLVGLTDEDLVRIAARRGAEESLAAAMGRHAAEGDPAAVLAQEALEEWRDLARRGGPFGFYATLLGPKGGRLKLVARLGSEAGDAIDAFLCMAHGAESVETPSLTTFLARFGSASHEVKRDLDTTRDEVRVMTVHGAKGLEAPIVILVDGCDVLGRDPALIPFAGEGGAAVPVWSPGRGYDSGLIEDAREALRARGLEEHNRLLYVAMTRAKDRLVIAPHRGAARETPVQAWCEMVRRGLVAAAGGLVHEDAPYGPIEVWRDGHQAPARMSADVLAARPPLAIPDWLRRPAPPEPEPEPPIRPSHALGAADRVPRPGESPFRARVRLRGTLIHALLERLPALAPERRESMARAYVGARAPRLPEEEQAGIVANTLAVLEHEDLAPLFGPGARAEAPVAGRVRLAGWTAPVSGQIDRLVILPDEVLFADFKTGAHPPRPDDPLPPPVLAQLALYRALLRDIHPEKRVRTFLVWTAGPLVRPVSESELDGALAAIRAA